MRTLRLAILTAMLLVPSLALAQSPMSLCVPAFNANTGFLSCVPVGQTSPNITTINPFPVGGVATAAAPTYTEGRVSSFSFDLSGNLRVGGSFTPSGTQDINLKQVNGGAVDVGHGTAAGAQRVELPTDGTGVVGLNAGSNIIGKVGIDQTTPGTTNLVALAANQSVNLAQVGGTNTVTGGVAGTQGIGGAPNITPADCSVTVTTGGTAQNAITAGAVLRGITIMDIDTGKTEGIWISFTATAAPNTTQSFYIPPYSATSGAGSYTTPLGFGFNTSLSVYAATTGHKISCTKW